VTGLSFKPLDNVALKVDYVIRDNDAGTANNTFNAGVAYQF
jgi:opacity protein-like surface antigen